MKRAMLGTFLLMLSLGVLAAACGSGGGDASGSNSKARDEIGVEMVDFSFKPSTISGEAGKEITVKLQNKGNAAHTFTVSELSVNQVVQPGETATVKVTPDKDGTFAFFCRFHRSRGMEGKLTVGSGGGGATPTASGSSGGGGYGY